MTFSDMLFLPRTTRSAVKRSARSEWCGDEARRQGRGPVVTGRLALRQLDVTYLQRLVRHLAQQMTDDVQAATSLAVGVRDMPRGPRGVRGGEHGVPGAGVVVPAAVGLQVHVRELPHLSRVVDSVLD